MLRLASMCVAMAFVSGHEHKCMHDALEKPEMKKLNLSTINEVNAGRHGQTLQSNFESLRMTTAFDASLYKCRENGVGNKNCWCTAVGQPIPTFGQGMTTCTSAHVLNAAAIAYLKVVLSEAVSWIQKAFKVERLNAFALGSGSCGPGRSDMNGVEIPNVHQTQLVPNTDILIYVSAVPVSNSGTVAWALGCFTSTSNDRPVAGLVNFNPEHFNTPVSTDTLEHRKNVVVTIHEIFHVLGFDSSSFKNPSKWFGGTSPLGANGEITSPEVRAQVREHYGCTSLTGAAIEQQGGSGTAGSHWEERTLGDEAMTGVLSNGVSMPISKITLALFKDTGVYDVVYSEADDLWWGKNKGCTFGAPGNTKACEADRSWEEYCWVDNRGSTLTPSVSLLCASGGGGPSRGPCLPSRCSVTLEAMSYCSVQNYDSLETQYQHFPANPTLGGSNSAYDYCPISVTTSESYPHFGSCADLPTDCAQRTTPGACSSGANCKWTTSCVTSIPENYGSTYGQVSRCFMTDNLVANRLSHVSSNEARCFKVSCNEAASTYTVEVFQTSGASQKVACPTAGGTVTASGYKGSITCWPYNVVCSGRGGVAKTQVPETLAPGTTAAPATPEPVVTSAPLTTAAPTMCSARMISQLADCLQNKDEASCVPSCQWCKIGQYSSACLYTGEACGTLSLAGVPLNYHTANQCPSVTSLSGDAGFVGPSLVLTLVSLLLLCVA